MVLRRQNPANIKERKMPGFTARRDRMRGDPKKFLRSGDDEVYSKKKKKSAKKKKY
jgi:hypothetical protein